MAAEQLDLFAAPIKENDDDRHTESDPDIAARFLNGV